MSSPWNHAICERCWFKQHPPRNVGDGTIEVRQPASVGVNQNIEICCYCSNLTVLGAYVRQDPAEVDCRGRHPETVDA